MHRAITSNIALNLQRTIREAGLRVVDQSLYDVNGRTCLEKKKENQRKKKRKKNKTRGGGQTTDTGGGGGREGMGVKLPLQFFPRKAGALPPGLPSLPYSRLLLAVLLLPPPPFLHLEVGSGLCRLFCASSSYVTHHEAFCSFRDPLMPLSPLFCCHCPQHCLDSKH